MEQMWKGNSESIRYYITVFLPVHYTQFLYTGGNKDSGFHITGIQEERKSQDSPKSCGAQGAYFYREGSSTAVLPAVGQQGAQRATEEQ